tara:strand:- start:178 stop:852 length:675 start_codon:yes stop_codon:yes gene_type:complete
VIQQELSGECNLSEAYNAIRSHITKFETELFTSLPAKVTAYNAEEQTIHALPVMTEPYKDGDVLQFAELQYIPVMFPSAGGGALTFPINVGDEVLIIFSSRNFDTWWETGESPQLPSTQRYNELTDAIALIGLTSKDKSLKANTEDVVLRYNDNSITLKKDGTLEAETTSTLSVSNGSEELISLLSDIVEEMSKITTNTIYGVSPVNNKIAIQDLKTRLDTFKV